MGHKTNAEKEASMHAHMDELKAAEKFAAELAEHPGGEYPAGYPELGG